MENIKSKISIFGSSGFIGQNLLKSISGSNGVSLRDSNWDENVMDSAIWINLVGKAHDHTQMATKEDFYYANLELTKQIFNSFKESNANLLIHVSSLAAVEEFEAKQILNEESTCAPQSWYGCSKREAEKWLLRQSIPTGKKIVILRPPMVHGAGDKGNLGLLYKIILKRVPYPLSSFDNKRSFICIDNFIFFIQQIIEKNDCLLSGIYHLSDDESISTKEIIEIIEYATGKKIMNIAIPRFIIKGIARIGDFIPIPLNSSRLRKMTGDLLTSNHKIKSMLGIKQLPSSAKGGLLKTFQSFK